MISKLLYQSKLFSDLSLRVHIFELDTAKAQTNQPKFFIFFNISVQTHLKNRKKKFMALSEFNGLFKQRKYPFLLSLFLLLIFVTFLFIHNSRSSPFLLPSEGLTSSPQVKSHGISSINNGDLQNWKLCQGPGMADYIPCLDNWKEIKKFSKLERKERHCPKPNPRCLVPLPNGYKPPVPWPKSRDMIWYDNVPHPKLVEYKKEQNWVVKSGDYLVFPGGGTQFKLGVDHYIESIEKILLTIEWGKHVRVVLDVGCGVASFGGYLLDKDVITMSFAPKDEHEAQIQFALERGIPATLSVIGTKRLPYPDNVYDVIHCARCRVRWDADGGKPLLELNRILRPGGLFIWSATPVYLKDEEHQNIWKAMTALTDAICWKTVNKTFLDVLGVGLVIYEKPSSSSCYKARKEDNPPLCNPNTRPNTSWYVPLENCLPIIPTTSKDLSYNWPSVWPQRLKKKLSIKPETDEIFNEDTKHWSALVSDVYLGSGLGVNWSTVRNVMDMNAGYGGFAAALIDLPLWVMNVVPVDGPDTLSVIFDRGLIGIYHDWCEPFDSYPRTYDLLHSSFLFSRRPSRRCDVVDVVLEMDRMLRPGGFLVVQETPETINVLNPILKSLHWSTSLYQQEFLLGKKGFWRPDPPNTR